MVGFHHPRPRSTDQASKPLVQDILIEGYENNRLLVAIAFVCKTLEPVTRSKVFRPPNPWLMVVLSLLAELCHYAELKLNAKFKIELLCKLDIDLDTVQATTILRNRPLSDSLAGPPLPDYVTDIDSLPIGACTDAVRCSGTALWVLPVLRIANVRSALTLRGFSPICCFWWQSALNWRISRPTSLSSGPFNWQ